MDDVIKNLTPAQALEVIRRLEHKAGAIRDAVIAEAFELLKEIDLDATAEEVFFVLDSIEVEECWDAAGPSCNGCTSPEDAAAEIIEERLEPYFKQTKRYHELGMLIEELTYCMGLILGVYRYEHESKSEFGDWSTDLPIYCAGDLLDEWRERNTCEAFVKTMNEFIQQRCLNWAEYFLRT